MSDNITGENRNKTDEYSSNKPPVKKQKFDENEIQSITAEEARSLLVERKREYAKEIDERAKVICNNIREKIVGAIEKMDRSIILNYKRDEDVLCEKVKDCLEKKGFKVKKLSSGLPNLHRRMIGMDYWTEERPYVLEVSW